VNDPLGEPGCTPLYAGLPSAWGSVDHEQMFSFFLFWESGRRGQGTDIILHGGPAGEFGRGLIYQGLEKALEMGTFLHRGPVKNHWGPFTGNSERDS